jgi:hypothetical protein
MQKVIHSIASIYGTEDNDNERNGAEDQSVGKKAKFLVSL